MKHFIYFICSIILCSCSIKESDYSDQTPEVIYQTAFQNLQKGDYASAAYVFSELERNYPYSDLSLKGQVLAGYALYLNKQYDEASEVFNAFIQLHPGNKQVAYALYMRGMCAYDQIPIVNRDQDVAEEAYDLFSDLIQRFPNTKYTLDAKKKLKAVDDHLAGKELSIGRYYLKNKSYVAAIKRFKNVLKDHPNSSQVSESYYRAIEAYKALNLNSEALYYFKKMTSLKDSIWYKKADELLKISN